MVIGTKKQNPYDKIKLRPKFYRNQLFKIDFMLKLIILANKWVSAHEVHKVFSPRPKLYTPSTLNIDFIQWHTQLNVCAVK